MSSERILSDVYRNTAPQGRFLFIRAEAIFSREGAAATQQTAKERSAGALLEATFLDSPEFRPIWR